MSKLILILISIASAIVLQFITLGVLGSSIAGNIPILGDILLIIDIGYYLNYLQGNITISTVSLILTRAVSIAATAYTLDLISKLDFFELRDSLVYKVFLFCIAVFVNYFILSLLSSIFGLLAEAVVGAMIKLDEVSNLLNELSL